jgi:pimeloyl-ACP methyl ester carboxylesterase
VPVERIGAHSAVKLRVAQRLARVPKRFPVQYGVELHRVVYWTELAGQPQLASGLLGIPRGCQPLTSVMWLNGTNPTRSEAPSGGGLVGLLVAAVFAGSGHLLLAPDYIGLGTSDTFHPYMHTTSTVDTATDFIRAVASYCESGSVVWSPRLMVVGFSQGAHAAVCVQRALEGSPIDQAQVLAVASIAPPLDLEAVTLPWALDGHASSHSTYLAFLAHSYARVYDQPLESVLTDDAAALATELFDGLHSSEDIAARLPPTPRQMFRIGWVDDFVDGRPSWFRIALEANEAVRWAPLAPLRLYYGDADVDVPPDDARLGAREMRQRGGNVELVAVGDFDHESVVYHAVPLVQKWFSGVASGAV